MKKIAFVIFLLLPLTTIGSAVEDGLFGKKLKKKPRSLQIVFDEEDLRIPNGYFLIGVHAEMPDGTFQRTRNLGGRLSISNFDFHIEGGRYIAGKIWINAKNRTGFVLVKVTARKYPDVTAVLKIPMHKEVQLLVKQKGQGAAAPGEKYRISVNAVFDNGQQLKVGSSKLPFNHYRIEVTGGTFKRGMINITDDPDRIIDHRVTVNIVPLANPVGASTAVYQLDYKKHYRFFNTGFFGFSGTNGCDGRDGWAGQFGQNGTDGAPGQHGDHAPPVDVYLNAYFDQHLGGDILVAEVVSEQKYQKYLINPEGGSLLVTATGGNGGDGGAGGHGGRGGDGQDGKVRFIKEQISDSTYREVKEVGPARDGGDGGDGGFGGDGGTGGNGGDIFVHFTLAAEPYLSLLSFDNDGGLPGCGGREGVGGAAGSGGAGEPNGHQGHHGRDGVRGHDGYQGLPGRVIYNLVFDHFVMDD